MSLEFFLCFCATILSVAQTRLLGYSQGGGFNEYLQFGGFPEIINQTEQIKRQILQGYFELTFYKDLVERYQIRNFGLMKELMLLRVLIKQT